MMKRHIIKVSDVATKRREILASSGAENKKLIMYTDLTKNREEVVSFVVFAKHGHVATTPDLKEAVKNYNSI